MGEEAGPEEPIRCHPECLKWPLSYWRQLLLQVDEESRGMSPGRLGDLMLRVRDAEAKARWPDYDGMPTGWWPDRPATRVGRQGIIELHLYSFGDDQIDLIFGFPDGTAATVLATATIHPKGRDIVAAHLAGHPPSRISRDLHVGIPTVTSILEQIGEEPHRLRDRAKNAGINHSVQRLYEEGRSYKEIAEKLEISESSVRQRLQYLRRKGRLEGPTREGGHGRRRAAS